MEMKVNDFSIQVATVNGSGSQSANNVLMRSLFRMGIPVSGKNLFPSNIQGLPTWFTIRANKHGYIARKKEIDILVCMNPESVDEDVASMRPGSVFIQNDAIKPKSPRSDLITYSIPMTKLVTECCPDAKLRRLVINMIYVGVVAEMLGLTEDSINLAMNQVFSGKAKAIEVNKLAVIAGRKFFKENCKKEDAFRAEPMNKTQGKIMIEGNHAAAIGCAFGGVNVCAWYPITPSSSVVDYLTDVCEETRKDANGNATYAIIQAEDELAAVGMVLGAGWAGARSMTATSGPGISLMAEFVGLSYFAEIPGVIWNIARVGPSTGLPTRTSQADLDCLYKLSHGDKFHPVLIPGSVKECYEFGVECFNLADDLQTTIFVMSDLDLGMNNWMSDPFDYPEKPISKGKVMTAEDLAAGKVFERYRDVDGDGICYRTYPGTAHPKAAYFTRGTGHNEKSVYTERPEDYVRLMDRLRKKLETARAKMPAPVLDQAQGARVGIIAFGSSDEAVKECRDQLKAEKGLTTSYLRVRALPLHTSIRDFVKAHDVVYVVEQSRDAALKNIMITDYPDLATKFKSVLHYNGMPIDARFITDAIGGNNV